MFECKLNKYVEDFALKLQQIINLILKKKKLSVKCLQSSRLTPSVVESWAGDSDAVLFSVFWQWALFLSYDSAWKTLSKSPVSSWFCLQECDSGLVGDTQYPACHTQRIWLLLLWKLEGSMSLTAVSFLLSLSLLLLLLLSLRFLQE